MTCGHGRECWSCIGACATAGGIQAMRNWGTVEDWAASVYPDPSLIKVLDRVTPVSDHVKVDAELRGCPISPEQLREFLTAALVGRRPQLPDEAVCLECKRRGYPCVVVAANLTCLGPVTRTGCGALCPAFGRGCYGCFGPREQPNVASLTSRFAVRRIDARRGRPPVRRVHRLGRAVPRGHSRRRPGEARRRGQEGTRCTAVTSECRP